jgi:hypothetical protein
MTYLGLPWFLWLLVAAALVLAGYATADFLYWARDRLAKSRLRVDREDFLVWTMIGCLTILSLLVLPESMVRYCEPGFTCELLP